MIKPFLSAQRYLAGMTNRQMVGNVDRWLERAVAPLVAAALIGLFIMSGDIRVIKEQMASIKADSEFKRDVDASQNATIRQLNERVLILETRNP